MAFLAEALDSAQRQDYTPLEILVSDDGSTDGTQSFVRSLAREDKRVRLLTDNPTRGIFTNINHLVGSAQGEAFCILGDDDRLLPNYVAALAKALLEHESVLVSFCDHYIIGGSGQPELAASTENSTRYGRAELEAGLVRDPQGAALRRSICMGFAMFRASPLRAERFDVACGGAADWDFLLRVVDMGEAYYVKERLAEYRSHPGSATQSLATFMDDGALRALDKRRYESVMHEDFRLGQIRAFQRSRVISLACLDKVTARSVVAEYRAAGGSAAHPRILLACFLLKWPQRFSTVLHEVVRRYRER